MAGVLIRDEGRTPTGCEWPLFFQRERESRTNPSWQEKHMRSVLAASCRPESTTGIGSYGIRGVTSARLKSVIQEMWHVAHSRLAATSRAAPASGETPAAAAVAMASQSMKRRNPTRI